MTCKILAALFVAVALVAAGTAVPGLVENVAYACQPSDPGCDN